MVTVSYYLSQLAVLDMIRKHLGDPDLLKFLNLYCHMESDDDTEVKYDVQCNREGPALNVSIEKENTDLKVPCFQVASEKQEKILDADFTLALHCPKFPAVGKCKSIFYLS